MLLWLTGLITILVSLPILALVAWLFVPAPSVWQHLIDTVLADYFFNSFVLSSGTAIGAFIIGSATAWLCSSCDFVGRKFYRWALILPLAYPSYVIAYTYTGIFDYGGSFYVWSKAQFGTSIPIPIRSIEGAITVITFSLYPYVYLLAYSAWYGKSNRLLETGRILQKNAWENFFKIALPLGRPAIMVGCVIVIMETLADYGTVQHFGIQTFSLGIMNTWFGLNSLSGAAQLSIILLFFTAGLITLEKKTRNHAQYTEISIGSKDPIYHLHGMKSLAANIACAIPILFGFIVPSSHLIFWTYINTANTDWNEYLVLLINTLSIALIATLLILFCSIVLAYARRFYTSPIFLSVVRVTTSGYAVPGVVIAAAVMSLGAFIKDITGLLLSGSFLMLIVAYIARFLTLGSNTVNAALEKISINLDYSAQTLNASRSSILYKIHLPIIKPAILTALLLVFVDVIKELPATLALRPFNFNTFAVKTYEMAADERITDMALPALSITVIGLLPLIILTRALRLKKQ